MTVTPGFILTAQGAAAFASSEAGAPVSLAYMVFGDANGVPYTPSGGEAQLRHEVQRVALQSAARDPDNAGQLLVTGVLPAGIGGFPIFEVGVLTADGHLALIGPANIYKTSPAEGVVTDLELTVTVAVSAAAQVEVVLDDSVAMTRDDLDKHRDFFAVKSATLTAPPGAPAADDAYLVPAGAAGAWANAVNQVAIWRDAVTGWFFVDPPAGAQVNAADTIVTWVRVSAGGWVQAAGFGGEATKASAATCDLGATGSHVIKVTGSAAISSFGGSADVNAPVYVVRFTGAAKLVASAAMTLPGGGDLQLAAGDVAFGKYEGAGNWRVAVFQPAGGYERLGAAAAAVTTANQHTDQVAAGLAPLSSPVFRDFPQVPTAPLGTSTTQAASTAFVYAVRDALVNGAPAVLDTLKEIADRIAGDEGVVSGLVNTLATKAAITDVQTWDQATLAAAKAYTDAHGAKLQLLDGGTVENVSFSSIDFTFPVNQYDQHRIIVYDMVVNAGGATFSVGLSLRDASNTWGYVAHSANITSTNPIDSAVVIAGASFARGVLTGSLGGGQARLDPNQGGGNAVGSPGLSSGQSTISSSAETRHDGGLSGFRFDAGGFAITSFSFLRFGA